MPVFVPRPGRRQNPGPGRKHNRRGEETVNVQGDAEKRTTTTTRTGIQHEGPRGAEPTEQGQSSGAEGQARATQQETEVEHKPRVANATSGEDQPDCATHQDCATHGEASEHIGIHTSSNAHPDCVKGNVKNPHAVTEHEGEPACDTHRERTATPGSSGRRLPLPCKPTHDSPVFVPRPGRRQQPTMARKTREPRTSTPPGTAANLHKREIHRKQQMDEHEPAITQVIDQVRKGSEEATVHHKGG